MSAPENPQLDPQRTVSSEPIEPPPANAPDPATGSSLTSEPIFAMPVDPPPVENPVWNGWDVLLTAVLIFVFVIVLQVALAKIAQVLWFPHGTIFEAAQAIAQKTILLIASQFVIYVVAAMLMVVSVEGKYHTSFWRSIGWNWPKSFWKFVALGAALFLALSLFESLLPMPKDTPFEHLFDRPIDAYLLSLIAISFAPVMEEVFFRGFMYPVLARSMGVTWAVVLSALPFALLHLPQYAYAWAAGFVIFVVGVGCGVVRATTKSVAASVLVHAGYNSTQMLIAVLWTRGFTHMPKGLLSLPF